MLIFDDSYRELFLFFLFLIHGFFLAFKLAGVRGPKKEMHPLHHCVSLSHPKFEYYGTMICAEFGHRFGSVGLALPLGTRDWDEFVHFLSWNVNLYRVLFTLMLDSESIQSSRFKCYLAYHLDFRVPSLDIESARSGCPPGLKTQSLTLSLTARDWDE